VWGTNGTSGKAVSFASVSEGPKSGKYSVQSEGFESTGILHDDEGWAQLGDDAVELEPQAGAGAFHKATPLPRQAHILTREPPAQHIHGRQVARAYGADIIEPLRVRPTLGKDATAPRGLLDLPDRVPDSGPL
jgi:hypothetical protein